jgi:DNA-binding response OmpR family regulator
MKDNELLQAGEPAGALVPGPTHSPPRILVVDDNSDVRRLYTEVLARPGYLVDAAEDGAAGWEAIQANSYNLMITENEMPGLTGVELVRKLRSARMVVPVVMAAVKLPTLELVQNPPLQLAALLPKPFYLSELLQTVRAVLRTTDSFREPITPPPNQRSQPAAVGLRL